MSLSSDDEDSNSSHHRPTSSSSVINGFEDAFSDTDDYDVSFEFSPAAIRADLAKNLNHVELNSSWDPDDDMRALAGRIGLSTPAYSFGAHNGDEQQSPPTQQPPSSGSATPSQPPNADSLDDINLNVGFSSISLHSPQLDGDNGEEHVDSNSPRFARYPITQTNASEEHVAPSVGRADTPSVSSVRSHSSSPPQEPDPTVIPLPITPNSSNAMSSAVSLSIPASASLPTPSSSHEVTAINHPSQTKHRPTRSAGPSMLDKVVSKTRPKFLPPKDRAEDKKHMADWETMMKRSRAAGEFD
ncbi:hypothetical protein EW026_g7226 [Hermanssonia centrifuga]|uniref:Uncharacterized protein n=1 Tax=Hermanssonia centrifuga TaxID=98765 RepID=A0A4S4KAA8_9APHY|nr:hypothetical protein EW026_g7226 [Hermanssonia centrifuga]